ncbi:protein kinase domain-containing protein [Streptomyces ossamyceticus]|uniref:serine/threonine-protein kinase n=1 Tax=Streptomyces ossamyceticus TaxID=249581 RepID=UPI0006E1A19F|nr:serine/threonine-protein kinase [Streptomyces ossamyceticus]
MAQEAQGAPGNEELPDIPGYRIDSHLGSGGMGHVYLGTSPSGRQVAVKVIRGNLAHQPDFRGRFRREVTAARQVSGAFTAPVVDADPDADPPWMATLFVPGQPLDERVTKGPALTDEELYRLATGLAEALRDIHRVGIVHRDLKPGNVLLADDGPRVIDFGIVRAADDAVLTAPGLTGTGVTIGTPPFMSPEQIRAQKDVGPRSDIFSLGSMLTYAASGRVPFDATDVYTLVYQLVHEPPKLDALPGWLRPTVERCLAKEPDDRPDAAELLSLLADTYPGTLEGPATPPAASPAPDADAATDSDSDSDSATDAGARGDTASDAGADADTASDATDMGSVTTDLGRVPTPPPRRGRRRRMLTVAAAVVAVSTIAGGLVYEFRAGGEGTGTRPTTRARTVTSQPKGSAEYIAAQSGSPNFSYAYHDSPERRPDGWRQWQYNLQNSDCVYADSSLVCLGDRAVRIDAATGKELWRNSKVSTYGSQNSPVVVGDIAVVNVGDRLVGLSLADGSVKWRYATAVLADRLMSDGERVYSLTEDGTVYSVDARTGTKPWVEGSHFPSRSGTVGQRVLGDRFYVFTTKDTEIGDDYVTVLDKDSGRRLDSFKLPAVCSPGTEALLEEDGKPRLYCVAVDKYSAPSGQGVLRMELTKGAEVTRTEAGAALGAGQAGPELSVTPGRVMYVAPTATGGELVSVDAARRKELWRVPIPSKGHTDAPPIQAGDRVYVVNGQGAAAFDARTGKLLYRHSLPYLDDDSDFDIGLDTEPLVAGGILYAPSTKAGWVAVDTEAT